MSSTQTLHGAIRFFGARAQEAQAIEECAELIQAINKKWRGKEHNIAEEIADVEIMLEQLKIINNCGIEVEKIKFSKLQRLHELVEEKKAEIRRNNNEEPA